jgi:hypothetical protein
MKKKRTIVSLTRGVRPELRERGIKIDKAGRARRGGKFLTLAAVARAVTSLKKTPTRRPTRRPPAVPQRETPRERQMRQRAERAEKLLAVQEARISKQREEMRTLRARQKRAAAKATREAKILEKARREQAKAAREEKKRRTKALTALETQRAQAQKRLEDAAKAAAPPPPEPEPEKKPRKGKKPKRGKKKPPVELPDSDEIILASWNQLTYEQQQIARTRLSAAGKKELDRRQREQFEREQAATPGVPVVAAKSPEEMRADLIKAVKRKGAKKAIAEEVNNAIVRKKPVPAWEEQHRATMRHPNMIVQTDKEAIKAANKGEYPKRERKGTRYHATVVCITQHPPLQKYGPTTIDGFEDLFVMYVSAQGATSRTGIKQNVARAIREVLMQVPGGAPIFVAAIEVRTSRKKEK